MSEIFSIFVSRGTLMQIFKPAKNKTPSLLEKEEAIELIFRGIELLGWCVSMPEESHDYVLIGEFEKIEELSKFIEQRHTIKISVN